jgi:hypothetical protein
MTKIIFLDVDGVLNSWNWWDEREKLDPEHKHDDAFELDPKAIEVLKTIIDRTGAKIVVSSTWRFCYYNLLISLLKEVIPYIEVIGKTPRKDCDMCVRGNEILKWLKDNEAVTGVPYHIYKNYLILDDDSDMLYWQKDNFIKTHYQTGLIEEYVDKAVEILNKE